MALGFEGYSCTLTRSLSRKRIVVSTEVEASSPLDSNPLKRARSEKVTSNSEISRLESLPPEILVKVVCGVDHEDLKHLILVSKTIREATEIAKRSHFEFSTPKKQTFGYFPPFYPEDESEFPFIEPPGAPLRKSKTRARWENQDSIIVCLFGSPQ